MERGKRQRGGMEKEKMREISWVYDYTWSISVMFALMGSCTQVARPSRSSCKLHSVKKAKNAKNYWSYRWWPSERCRDRDLETDPTRLPCHICGSEHKRQDIIIWRYGQPPTLPEVVQVVLPPRGGNSPGGFVATPRHTMSFLQDITKTFVTRSVKRSWRIKSTSPICHWYGNFKIH